ncbi:MAG TPA: hypothetical protein V6C52_14340 [Coleofasciculaceae cyanobacterium]
MLSVQPNLTFAQKKKTWDFIELNPSGGPPQVIEPETRQYSFGPFGVFSIVASEEEMSFRQAKDVTPSPSIFNKIFSRLYTRTGRNVPPTQKSIGLHLIELNHDGAYRVIGSLIRLKSIAQVGLRTTFKDLQECTNFLKRCKAAKDVAPSPASQKEGDATLAASGVLLVAPKDKGPLSRALNFT